MNYSKRLIMILASVLLTLTYQNCSKVGFGSSDPDGGLKTSGDPTFIVEDPEDTPDDPANPEDPEDPRDNRCFACDIDNIADIRVNILSAYVGSTPVTVGTGLRSLIQMSAGFNILLTTAASSNQIRLVLGDGNLLVDDDGNTYPLKTPSGQQSGIKINLNDASRDFDGNTAYTIKFALDPEFQVVRAGKKCLLKPVLRATSVTKVEF